MIVTEESQLILLENLKNSASFKLKGCKYQADGVNLRPYQQIGVGYMLLIPRLILGDDTGLGKTAQATSAYIRLYEKDQDLSCLVVTVKSSIYQWAREVRRFSKNIKVMVLDTDSYEDYRGKRHKALSKEKSTDFRKKCINIFKEENYNILVLNYALMMIENNELVSLFSDQSKKFMLIYDEATFFKTYNPKSKYERKTKQKKLLKEQEAISRGEEFVDSGKEYISAYQAALNLSLRASRCYGLTATPIKNRLEEAYSLYKVINPELFGNITSFRNSFCVYKQLRIGSRYINKLVQYKNLKDFSEKIKPYYLGRSKREVAPELPPIINKNILLKMHPFQEKKYEESLHGLLTLGSGVDKYPETLAKLSYCQSISNTPTLIGFPKETSSKEEELDRLLNEELDSKKVIVYTNSKEWIDKLSLLYKNSVKITGDVSGKNRQDAMDKFTNSPDCNLIFINKAGIESINLQVAGTIIFLDTPWSYGDYLQCLTGESRILTKSGYEKLSYVKDYGQLWTGHGWATYEKYPIKTTGLYEIKFKSGRVIKTSSDHSFKSAKDMSWIKVSDIKPGFKVLRNWGFVFDHSDNSTDDCDIFYLAGLITGDGFITFKKRDDSNGGTRCQMNIVFGKHEKYVADRAEFLLKIRGFNTSLEDKTKECNIYSLSVYQQEILKFFEKFDLVNKRFNTKRVPEVVFKANKDQRRAYLLGLYDSDGSKASNNGWHQNNHLLVRDIQLLHDLEGLDSTVFKTSNAWQVRVKGFPNNFKLSDWYDSTTHIEPWEWKCNPEYWVNTLLEKFNSLRKIGRPSWVNDGLKCIKNGKNISEKRIKEVAEYFNFPVDKWSSTCSIVDMCYIFTDWYKESAHAHKQPLNKQFGCSLRDLRRGRSVSLSRLRELSDFLCIDVPFYRDDEISEVVYHPNEEATVYKIIVHDPLHQYMADGFIHKNCIGRAQRIGSQQESILVIHLVNENTIDEYKLQILLGKKHLVEVIFGEDKENILNRFSEDDVKMLLVNAMKQGSLEKLKEEECDLLDIDNI